MRVNIVLLRGHLQQFRFKELFNELGWGKPTNPPSTVEVESQPFTLTQVAQLAGVQVFEVSGPGGQIPEPKIRRRVYEAVSKQAYENLLIFVDGARAQSVWYWAKREGKKTFPREHFYDKNQSGDLLISKIQAMFVDFAEFDEEGNVPVVRVAEKLKAALDVEQTTKQFFREFDLERKAFTGLIEGIDDERERAWYASVLLHRMMFIYFLQKKNFLDGGNVNYLQDKLAASQARGPDRYYSEFLQALFFEGFAKPEEARSPQAKALLGRVKYLNGGLFLPHRIEEKYKGRIRIPDRAFENLLSLFTRYSWHLDDAPGGKDNEINPDVLGYIFEKYINQKAFGAYYTRPEITEYLCERTIYPLILERASDPDVPGMPPGRKFDSVPELLMRLDNALAKKLVFSVLPSLKLLDPACGSGAFLIAAMKTLFNVYASVIGWIEAHGNHELKDWLKKQKGEHKNFYYFVKKRIITDNLFGVDIMAEATEIARLRLFLALVASAHSVDELEPLPNIDFNILAGNSLIGLLHVDEKEYDKRNPQQGLFTKRYPDIIAERLRKLEAYRHAAQDVKAEDLRSLRDDIEKDRQDALVVLNEMLRDEFGRLGIKYEEATWDEAKGKEGKPKKRAVTLQDIEALQPFHWGFEFSEVMASGGFDAIITNPPWDVWEPRQKEFAQDFAPEVHKNKISIEEWEKQFAMYMQDSEVRESWLRYASRFGHTSDFFRKAPQFKNNISVANGRNVSGKNNLYALFTEQCFNLLKPDGYCGTIIPDGIYNGLSNKGLRELLFSQTTVTGLFCFENRKAIFEGVDSRFKFVILTFEKKGSTRQFPAAFMRGNVGDLSRFPKEIGLEISVDLIRKLNPDTLAIKEFKNEIDRNIAQKLAAFPPLKANIPGIWQLNLRQELNMTADKELFHSKYKESLVPLVQGAMFHQFEFGYAPAKKWLDPEEARRKVLGREEDRGQVLSYQTYRFVHRRIARSTDTRTLIATVLPPNCFCADTAQTTRTVLPEDITLFITALMNSFVVDFEIRQQVTTHCDQHFMYGLHIPRLTQTDPRFMPIVTRAARLICTTPEFDDLARAVGLKDHTEGATDPAERARLRAELDGLVAHLYGLTEEEFKHILGTFPLVKQEVKDAALEAFREFAPKAGDLEIAALIQAGESSRLEFKSTARWNVKAGQPDKKMEEVILKTVTGFWNAEGGTLLIGVEDDGNVYGLEADYKTLGGKGNRDGYELFLTDLLLRERPELRGFLSVTFHQVDGKDVCKLEVKKAPRPVFLSFSENGRAVERFFVRVNNSTREFTMGQALEYIQTHWK